MSKFKIQKKGLKNMVRALVVMVCLFPYIVLAASSSSELELQIEQVRRDREVLLQEQARLQTELEKVNQESQTLGTAVKSLDTAKKKLAKDIGITQSKITSTNLTIQSLESSMSLKEQQIVTNRQAIRDMLSLLSEYDSRSFLFDLLASANLSDLWKDQDQLESLNDRLENEIDSLRATRIALAEEKEKKEEVKKEQLSLKNQLNGQKLVVEENQMVQKQLLSETKNKEAEYQRMLTENLARQKESEEDLYRLESALQITLDPTLIPVARHGVLSWPLETIFVTDPFGQRATRYHNGVDFRASVGTPVKSVASGVVQGMGNTDEQKGCYSFGRWILIRHDNGLSSVYAHLSASVTYKNQRVETGEVIGYSGGYPRAFGSGNSRGPHLHLGLFASQGVEIRQFTTSKGCKQVFVPIALGISSYLDPLDYLPSL